MKNNLTLLVTLFFISSLPDISSVGAHRCHQNDYNALMELKNSFNTPRYMASWIPHTDCCDWLAVNCSSKTNRVSRLSIVSADISGQISPMVGDLSHLVVLIFRNLTKITGPIPQTITKLKSLGMLRLSLLSLTGRVPRGLGKLTDLNFIDLAGNQLVGDASMLFRPNGSSVAIDLSRNLFEFDFSQVSLPKNLVLLDVSHNKIYGSIPKEANKLKQLLRFDVSYNRLCGEIPNGASLNKFNSSAYAHNQCLCGPPLLKCK